MGEYLIDFEVGRLTPMSLLTVNRILEKCREIIIDVRKNVRGRQADTRRHQSKHTVPNNVDRKNTLQISTKRIFHRRDQYSVTLVHIRYSVLNKLEPRSDVDRATNRQNYDTNEEKDAKVEKIDEYMHLGTKNGTKMASKLRK